MRPADVSATWKALRSKRKVSSLEALKKISQEVQIDFIMYIFTIVLLFTLGFPVPKSKC